jgi:hypothetical protein
MTRLRFLEIMPQEALIIGANSKDGTVQMYYDWMDVIPYAKTTTTASFVFRCHLDTRNAIFLPRQARDKHRESSTQNRLLTVFFSQVL